MTHAGIILCGGHSQRMGMSKAWLPFGAETMLQRVVRLLQASVETIVVVAARNQALPPLPASVLLAHDAEDSRGPMQGLLAGLSALSAETSAAFVTSCDVPLLVPAFVERMLELADGYDAAVPVEEEQLHPLSAVYRPSVIPAIEQLLSADNRRLKSLFDHVATRRIDVADLRSVDPSLVTLRNLNTPDDYFAAAAEAGSIVPEDVRQQLSS